MNFTKQICLQRLENYLVRRQIPEAIEFSLLYIGHQNADLMEQIQAFRVRYNIERTQNLIELPTTIYMQLEVSFRDIIKALPAYSADFRLPSTAIYSEIEHIKRLSGVVNAPIDVFKINPYDSRNAFKHQLPQRLFNEHLYVDAHREKFVELSNFINGGRKIIFISGYAGVGKTTFLNKFKEYHDEFEHIIYDFQDQNNTTDRRTVKKRITDFILRMMKKNTFEDYELKGALSALIRNRRNLYMEDLLSEKLYNHLNDNQSEPLTELCDKLVTESSARMFAFKDVFTYFFTYIFRYNVNTTKKKIIYFDNLDALSTEYLVFDFLRHFVKAYQSIERLCQTDMFNREWYHDKLISSNFVFVFSVRDGNEAAMNPEDLKIPNHHRDDLRIKRFVLDNPPRFHNQLLSKRIQFMNTLFKFNEDKFKQNRISLITTALEALKRDWYFNDVIVPLYNKDYRSYSNRIIDVIIKDQFLTRENFRNIQYYTRGILLHGILKNLLNDNFIRDFPVNSISPDAPMCFMERMLLTFIINTESEKESRYYGRTKTVSLSRIVTELNQYYADEPAIIQAIARCFLYHTREWTHLITITGKRITDEEQFIESLAEGKAKDPNHYDTIFIRSNPSAFAYIRYILPHFEFYATFCRQGLSIFELGLEKNARGVFLFALNIREVLTKFRIGVNQMELFFNRNMQPMTPEAFKQAVICWRIFGRDTVPRERGYFHTVRVVCAHLDYLSHFRLFVLGKVRTPNEIEEINRIMVAFFEDYIAILKSPSALDYDAKDKFAPAFEEKIKIIKENLRTDTKTSLTIKIDTIDALDF